MRVKIPEPDAKGFVQGWGVVRMQPWHLYEVFATKEQAEFVREGLGPEYEVRPNASYIPRRDGQGNAIGRKGSV